MFISCLPQLKFYCLFFYSPILTNNNLLLKIYCEILWKYCGNIYQLWFFILFILFPFYPCILTLLFFFFFYSLVFSPPHLYPHPHPHSSHLVFIFLELFLHTTCPLCFYFSFFISSSLFLILFLSYSHPVTHILPAENKARI